MKKPTMYSAEGFPIPVKGLAGKVQHATVLSQTDRISAAEIIEGYHELIVLSRINREAIIRGLRSAMETR